MKYRITHIETIVRVFDCEADNISRAESMIGPVKVADPSDPLLCDRVTLVQAWGQSNLTSVPLDPQEFAATIDNPSHAQYRDLYDELASLPQRA